MKSIGILSILIVILTACTSATPTFPSLQPWQLSEIRYLEIPNNTEPGSDMIAIYTRQINDEFQIRLDILDLQPDFNLNFYILLDTTPAENTGSFPACPVLVSSRITYQGWDWLLALPINEDPQVFLPGKVRSESGLTPRIQRDPLLDTVTISINRNNISILENFIMQVFVTTIDGEIILDQSPPISSQLSNPISPAPLVIAFNDSFPAATPAQALRAWDGAHTGPTGERHGLKHVLSNSDKFNIPIVLLDLKTPNFLAALDLMGAIPLVQTLIKRDLLLLPDLAFAIPDELSLQTSQQVALTYGLQGSPFVYSTDGQLQSDHQYQFVNLPDRSHLLLQAGKTLIPNPNMEQNNDPIQATDQGLSLEVRQQLLKTAISPDPTDLVILGGSLPHSTWGDSDMSIASMAYIAAHPWIQPLKADEIQAFPSQPISHKYEPPLLSLPPFPVYTSQKTRTTLDSIQLQAVLLQDLRSSSQNTITDLAWQMFFTLSSPLSKSLNIQLNYQYINQVESLLAASRWVESRATISDCSQDIDLDSLRECILSNPHFFAIIEPDGGRLSFLFERAGDQIHQWVGPMSQFSVGLSDPSLWHLENGPAADSSEIPGAFNDSDAPFMMYDISDVQDGLLIMERADGQINKFFQLKENGLSIDSNSKSPLRISIPLAIDPQLLFQPGWVELYYSQKLADSFIWGVQGGTSVKILTTGTISAYDFTESSPFLNNPENPDLDYPPGHFLPFPLALVEITSKGHVSVDILIGN